MISRGYLDGSKALVYAAGQDDIAEFAKGEAGFMPGGSWFVAGLDSAAPDMNYTLGGIPVQDEDSLILINAGVRVCINSSSEKKEVARKFVEFFTGLDSMNAYVASQNSFNPRVWMASQHGQRCGDAGGGAFKRPPAWFRGWILPSTSR